LYSAIDFVKKSVWVFEQVNHQRQAAVVTQQQSQATDSQHQQYNNNSNNIATEELQVKCGAGCLVRGQPFLLVSVEGPSTRQLRILNLRTFVTERILDFPHTITTIYSIYSKEEHPKKFVPIGVDFRNVVALGTAGGHWYLTDLDFEPGSTVKVIYC
jgi:hypothetical protein